MTSFLADLERFRTSVEQRAKQGIQEFRELVGPWEAAPRVRHDDDNGYGLGPLPEARPTTQWPIVSGLQQPQGNSIRGPGQAPAARTVVTSAADASPISRSFDAIGVPASTGRVRTITDNNDAWVTAWNIVDSAKERIDASYYIFNRDVFGYAYLGALLRKQRENVPVHLLLDGTGDSFGRLGFTQAGRGQDYLQTLTAAGAQVSVYNPLLLKLPRQAIHPTSTLGLSANHDKIVATERYAMSGGRNVAAHYFSAPDDHEGVYRDTDIVVDNRDAATRHALAVRTEMYQRGMSFVVRPDLVDMTPREAELLGTAAMMDAWLAREPFNEAQKRSIRASATSREQLADGLVAGALERLKRDNVAAPSSAARAHLRELALEMVGNLNLAGSRRNSSLSRGMNQADIKVLDRTSVGATVRNYDQISAGLGRLLDAATDRVLITNPYVVLSEDVRVKMEAAARRGVRIELLTNSPDSSDSAVTQAFFLADWPRLLARIPNMRIYVMTGDRKLHAKTAVADSQITATGSFNLDLISGDINGEVVTLARSREEAARAEATFRSDIADARNKVVEYTIERDASGKPVIRNGEPVVKFGPENHVAPGKMRMYHALEAVARGARDLLPQLEPLREPPRAFQP